MNAHGAAKFLLSRLAGEHVKVVLSGEGADELLMGYAQFRHHELLDRNTAHPRRPPPTGLRDFFATTASSSG